ncbi:MAG: plasmid maintenance protein [Candidatus Acidoferrum typicum]|nr:plasmid maintenance protein [Candidatus Acidoferrum typicum]
METRFLLDTNTLIYIRRNRPARVLARFQKLSYGEAAFSVITFGELAYGAAKSVRRSEAIAQLDELRSALPIIALPETAAEIYGVIRADLEGRGQQIGNNDLWIAAHAVAANLILVTNNETEFARVKGLKVQNWAV